MTADVLIWGAGAIGGTIGAYLVRAGQPVVFVDIVPEHVAAIAREPGLAITGPVDEFCVRAPAHTPATLDGVFDTVLLCVKAQDTALATRALAPHLAADGCIVSVQNGLNELAIAEIVGRDRVVGCFINFGADYEEPGVINFGGRGAVVLGELDGRSSARLAGLHQLFRLFEPATEATDNILGYLWGKLGYGALLVASALTNEAIADVLAAVEHRELLTALAAEVLAVAATEGVEPLGFNGFEPDAFGMGAAAAARTRSFKEMEAHNRSSAKSHSGIWRDLAVRKRQTEVAPLLGPVVSQGKVHDMPTPLVARLCAMIAEIEAGTRKLSGANLAELAATMRKSAAE